MSALSEFTHNHSSEQKRTDHPIASARRVRCFAQHDRGKVMPQVDGVEYVSDPETAFDLIFEDYDALRKMLKE